jgi:hypothetical protein
VLLFTALLNNASARETATPRTIYQTHTLVRSATIYNILYSIEIANVAQASCIIIILKNGKKDSQALSSTIGLLPTRPRSSQSLLLLSLSRAVQANQYYWFVSSRLGTKKLPSPRLFALFASCGVLMNVGSCLSLW